MYKKVTKKVTDKQIIDKYAKKVEKDIISSNFQWYRFERYRREFDKAKLFDIGDIVNMSYCDPWGSQLEYNWKYYCDDMGNYTNVKIKFKVTFKDSQGYCHIQEIQSDGSLSKHPIRLDEELNNFFIDGIELDNSYCFNNMVVVDPNFINATLLGVDYEPLAEYNIEKQEREDEDRAKVEAYYKVITENYKTLIPTRLVKERNKFYKDINVGDVIYLDECKATIKIKQDKILVMLMGKKLYTYKLINLKRHELHTMQPTELPNINYRLLKKYKS